MFYSNRIILMRQAITGDSVVVKFEKADFPLKIVLSGSRILFQKLSVAR